MADHSTTPEAPKFIGGEWGSPRRFLAGPEPAEMPVHRPKPIQPAGKLLKKIVRVAEGGPLEHVRAAENLLRHMANQFVIVLFEDGQRTFDFAGFQIVHGRMSPHPCGVPEALPAKSGRPDVSRTRPRVQMKV